MKELNYLKELGRVNAPPDFEQRVLTQLSLRKRSEIRVRRLRLSFAGAFGAVAILVIVAGLFFLPQKGNLRYSGLEKGFSPEFSGFEHHNYIPITESMEYAGEIRSKAKQPRTIYILEQVSDTTDTRIKY
ncbi:MAG: hypothetical protein JW755_03660 [Candidatus Aminicenantes bacterium]|nr:hypothetical protein [Candidatus Aminicenantes bacterium]